MKQLKLAAIAVIFALGTISCQEEEAAQPMSNDQIDQEVLAENLLVELDELTEEGIDFQLNALKSGGADRLFLNDNCPVITYDKTSNPRKMILDFGTGCVGHDDKTRSGKIIITSSAFENLTLERVKTFENFIVEGKKIEGKIIKKITLNRENLSRVAEIKEDIKVTFEDNTILTRKANLTREQIFGIPGVRADNETKTWGEVITTRHSGATITKTIAEATPLLFKASCKQIVSGIVTFTNGDVSWTIDYGTGECDNTATVTRDGETRTVKLKK
jgi:hypothetical protein